MRSRIVSLCGLAAVISPQALRRMALVQTAAHVDGISGKVGNAVFAKVKAGATMRRRVVPANPRTAAQQTARLDLTLASKAFSTLTSTQRAAWDTYAASAMATNRLTGAKFALSAVSAFTRLSSKFKQVNPGSSIPLSPPASIFPGDTITITVTGGTAQAILTASAANAANVTTEFLAVKVSSINRRPALSAYRHKSFHAYVTGTLVYDLPLASGSWYIAYRYVDTATGEETTPVQLGIITVT